MKVIENALLIDPASGTEAEQDLLIEGGKISAIERRGGFKSLQGVDRIDASGKWLVPGLIDLHVHLREPGFEWKETIATGCLAAASGGYTTVCCMPNTSPVNHNAEITRFILEKAAAAHGARVCPIGAVSVDLKGEQMAPLSELDKAGCVAFSDDGEPVWDAGLMRRALEWARMLGRRIACHEEDKRLCGHGAMNESALSCKLGIPGIPGMSEDVMVARDIELARATRGKAHICHISTARSVELVRRAKNDGIDVTAEVTPHHLTLTEDAVADYDTNAKMNPPLREAFDLEGLRAGLADGTLDAIASDHAPHELDSKRVEFGKARFGIIGLQTNLPLVLELVRSGALTRKRAFEAMTSAPARVFNLPGGRLAKGAPADITLIDPEARWTFESDIVLSKSANSPFLGKSLQGRAVLVLRGGEVIHS